MDYYPYPSPPPKRKAKGKFGKTGGSASRQPSGARGKSGAVDFAPRRPRPTGGARGKTGAAPFPERSKIQKPRQRRGY